MSNFAISTEWSQSYKSRNSSTMLLNLTGSVVVRWILELTSFGKNYFDLTKFDSLLYSVMKTLWWQSKQYPDSQFYIFHKMVLTNRAQYFTTPNSVFKNVLQESSCNWSCFYSVWLWKPNPFCHSITCGLLSLVEVLMANPRLGF